MYFEGQVLSGPFEEFSVGKFSQEGKEVKSMKAKKIRNAICTVKVVSVKVGVLLFTRPFFCQW